MTYDRLINLVEKADSGTWGEISSENGAQPVLRSTNISGNKLVVTDFAKIIIPKKDLIDKQLLDGDIIITKSSGSSELIGKCAIFRSNGNHCMYYFSNFMLRIRTKRNILSEDWLYYYLISPIGKNELKQMNNTTSGLRNLNIRLYLNQKIPLPPLSEQKRIAEILDKADELRQKRKQSIALLDEYLKSVFYEMFGDPLMNDKQFPKEKLTQNCKRINVTFVGSCEKYYTDDSGVPLIRTGNLTDLYINWTKLKYVTSDFHNMNKKSQIKNGDILVARHGDYGKANLYRGEKGVINALNIIVITLDTKEYVPIFFIYLLNSDNIRKYIAGKIGGVTQKVVNTKEIRALELIKPPVALQSQFARIVEQVEQTKSKMQEVLKELDNLFNSLMQKAFRDKSKD